MVDIDGHLKDMSGSTLGTADNPVYVTIQTPTLPEFGVPQRHIFKNNIAHTLWLKTGRAWLWIGRKMKWTV